LVDVEAYGTMNTLEISGCAKFIGFLAKEQ